ncbi:MAG TPA: hypothetical protein VM328_03185 [Fimbriimonadaceae bacterium]|nr:hypothetical protein [Fimbriimonadaceae bacterium]
MNPLQEHVRLNYDQALRCVQYRVPKQASFFERPYEVVLGLRYGLIGVAAAHQVLLTAERPEEASLAGYLSEWPDRVEEHVRGRVLPILNQPVRDAFPIMVGEYANKPMQSYFALQSKLFPFEYYLEIVLSLFEKAHGIEIVEGVPLLRRRSARSRFHEQARLSLHYALRFLERREADLDEVPAIALLGE